ncbi:MAG: preprotein translocase subunit SecY [Christensenellales bacterium]
MFKNLKEALKIKDVRRKIIFTLLLLLVYRIGCWLPTPGIKLDTFKSAITSGGDFLNIISAVSGGALASGAVLALGVVPYINASIIIQLLTVAIPSLERLSKQGEDGRKKISAYTRICALVLAIIQSVGIVVSFGASSLDSAVFFGSTWATGALVVCILTAGSMFTVWIGEKITALGVGNGLSLLIFVGLLSSAGQAIFNNIAGISSSNLENIWTLLIFFALLVVIFAFIVWIDSAERKIPVQYAKQMKGRKMYGGQNTNIPIKINASGVMPIIFATALISFPQLIMSIFWYSTEEGSAYMWYAKNMGAGTWPYTLLVAVLILLFSYFYSQISFNPEDVSRQIQQNGGFIPGYRPGKTTADYLKKVSNRLTLWGAIFLGIIALVPSFIFTFIGSSGSLVNAFSATGLLIVVSVALELDKQLEAQLLMRNYKGFLK